VKEFSSFANYTENFDPNGASNVEQNFNSKALLLNHTGIINLSMKRMHSFVYMYTEIMSL
jgi:hypothetical protein